MRSDYIITSILWLLPPPLTRVGILKLFSNPGIDSKESIPPAYLAWRAGTTTSHGS